MVDEIKVMLLDSSLLSGGSFIHAFDDELKDLSPSQYIHQGKDVKGY